MRPSSIYSKIESALADNASLATIPRVQNTYQEKLVDGEASDHLKECGLVICVYFLRLMEPDNTRPNLVLGDALYTIAVLENITKHREWNEENPEETTFKAKSALEVAEEVLVTLVSSKLFRPCGVKDVKFGKPSLERVYAEKGMSQMDVNLLAPTQIKS